MSLLTICQRVCATLSLTVPTAVAASTDKTLVQLMALANEEGEELARFGAWEALVEEENFVTVAADVQPSAVPTDFDRFVPDTFFNRTTRREVTGPMTPRQWQFIKANPVSATVYLSYRERQGSFLISPQPPAGQAIYYEYVSINWCKSATGAPQSAFQFDSDTAYLDETLIAKGLRWRYLKAKGLEYDVDYADYTAAREMAFGRDGGVGVLDLAPRKLDDIRLNLPDGNFGVP